MVSGCYCYLAWADIQALSVSDKEVFLLHIQQNDYDNLRHSITAPDEVFVKCNSIVGCICSALSLVCGTCTYVQALAEVANAHWDED